MPDDGAGHGSKADAAASDADTRAMPTEQEPVTTGTLFIVIVFLMALAGLWGILYLDLIQR